MTFEPFCVWWEDIHSDEVGFVVELTYNGDPSRNEQFVHSIVRNEISYVFPQAEWPRLDENGFFLRRHALSIRVYAVRPTSVDLIAGNDLTAQ